MNIRGSGGRSSSGGDMGDFASRKIFVFAIFFHLVAQIHTFTVEWSMVSPYQLQQQNRANWIASQGGKSANIDLSKGGQIAFVPAGLAGYGLYNRGYPSRAINVYLPKSDRSSESSSEEHRRKRHKKHHSYEKHHDYEPEDDHEYHPEHHEHHPDHQEHHPEHHKHHESPQEHLNNEHAEQAEVSAGIASVIGKMSEFMKAQLAEHVEMRDQEINRDNIEAAKKEQAIIDSYQEQIKYLDAIAKAQEAIMAGEVGMVHDDDGTGHHGHHDHGGNHHHGDHHHEADEPSHHHEYNHDADDDDDEGHGHHGHGNDDDDEGHGHHGHDNDDDDDDDDESHGHHGHGNDDDDEGHGHHGHGNDDDDDDDESHGHHGHGNDDDDDDEGHGHHGHGNDDDDDEGHGHHGHDNDDDDEGHGHHGHDNDDDDGEHEEDHDDTKHDPDYNPEDDGHKLDKRSPDLGTSYIPSLSSIYAQSPVKSPDTATVEATAKAEASADAATNTAEAKAEAEVTSATPTPSSTPYSQSPSTTDVSATAEASASATTDGSSASSTATATSTSSTSNSNSNSGWFSWFGSSNDVPTYSPYTLLQFLSPTDKSPDNLMSMFNVFSDPSNSSYLSNASTLMRVVMFFMPGTGIVDQVYFTMALSKIMWEAATMYYDGYGTVDIAVVVLGEMAEAAYLSRRDEDSIISQTILTPGETIKIEEMDVPKFLKYVKNMKYPDLTEAQEEKLRQDIDNLIPFTYPNISPELRTTFTQGLKDTIKFLALFNVDGDLKVENVDVNFSEVYINMHSAYEDSALEKIKKSILGAIDTIKSTFKN